MSAHVRFVLMRPRIAANLGAVARALKNFGFHDWVLVDPRPDDWAEARRLAVQSEDVLDSARRADSLDAAIADCTWVVGTSSRTRRGRHRLSAREVAVRAQTVSPVAIVFGDERSGLTNEELDRCHATSAIFTSKEQPSINLAQAVLLYAYELRLAGEVKAQPRLPKRATDGEATQVEEALAGLLSRGGFLRDSRKAALRDLRAVFDRAGLTRKEAVLWSAALRAVAKKL